MLKWVTGFKSRWGDFNWGDIGDNAFHHLLIVPDERVIAYNKVPEENRLQTWVDSRKILEKADYQFQGVDNIRDWEILHGKIERNGELQRV
jgi:hypothetical protein